ncbi:MAG TPA: adenylate/guanylate cyclase domain-containing protein [Dehalococcoidia bacterium]|nr:adenylate/guanylate cyclase domain-containing protein [Dehalococcoidia bacterium]
MAQDVRFCTTSDGIRIGYAVSGNPDGPTLLWVPGWVTHIELSEEHASFRAGHDAFRERFRLVVYDKRGTGLSDRGITDFSLDARMRDIEAVVADLKVKKLSLFAMSEGGPLAMAYAAHYPRRVSGMVLYGTFARPLSSPAGDALVALVRAEWGIASDTFISIFSPDATAEERQQWLRFSRAAATREEAALMLEANMKTDVSAHLPKIRARTLVLHARGDRAIAFERGREVAGGIRGARLVAIESRSHLPGPDDMREVTRMAAEFLLGAEHSAAPAAAPGGSRAPVAVMFTDVEGSTALTERLGDAGAREVLRLHERVTRDALRAHRGSEVKTMGDGFMATFASVAGGLACAVAIQRALAAHNATAADAVRVRIGMNAGEPVAEGSDLFGSAVNLAARIAATADGGEIVVSNVVRELCAGKGFRFTDRGAFVPKGFDEAVRLYEVRWQDDETGVAGGEPQSARAIDPAGRGA